MDNVYSVGCLLGAALAFGGGLLQHLFVIHYFLGTASFPVESLSYVSVETSMALLFMVLYGVLASGLYVSESRGLGVFLCRMAAMCGVVALYYGKNLSFPWVIMAATACLGCVSILDLFVKRKESTKGEKRSYSMLCLTVAVLAVLLRTTTPPSSCFASLSKLMPPQLVVQGNSEIMMFGGAFKITASSADSSFEIVRSAAKGFEERSLFKANPGQAFVAGALGGSFTAENPEEMGVYFFHDSPKQQSVNQTLDSIDKESDNVVVLRGKLIFRSNTTVDYEMRLEATGSDHIRFKLESSGDELSRIYLTQESSQAEEIFGMGVQYTFLDFKGGCVPVFTQEQGLGRGHEPVSFLTNLLVPNAAGSWETTYAPAAYYLTSNMRSLYLSSNDFSLFDFSAANSIRIEVNASSMHGGLIAGNDPLDVIETYTREHAGRMRRLPDWTGNGAVVGLQGGTEIVKEHVEQFRKAGVPLAALWLQDWTGKRETGFGRRLQWNWELSDKQYPGWYDLLRELAKDNIFVMTYINAYVANTGGPTGESISIYEEAAKLDCLVRNTGGESIQIQASATPDFTFATIDITNPRCEEWYIKDVIQKRMLGLDTTSAENINGAIGFMADFGESISMGAEFKAGPGYKIHNEFPVLWAKLCRKALEMNEYVKENGVFFTRAAGGQSPKHTTLMWMGDQLVTWNHYDGMQSALHGMLSSGMSGFSLGHSDIGGYTMVERFNGYYTLKRSPELFMRWGEMSAFSDSMFRSHEGCRPDISTQAVHDIVSGHFAKMATLHKRLFTAIKKDLMIEAENTGAPLARHLFLHYPNDPVARKVTSQFMLGKEILVCPVLEPSVNSRKCYLPKGQWTHVFTEETFQGGQEIECQAPIGKPCVLHLPGASNIATIVREVLGRT